MQIRSLYKFNKSCSYWLRRLENHQRKEPIVVAEYTIEHILPQNPALPSTWRESLGPEWAAIHEEWIDRLGNLTLTGYNSELSDRPFHEKRDHPDGGFRTSPLRLNQGLGELSHWDAEAIRKRGARLADLALTVWPSPQLSAEQRLAYAPAHRSSGLSTYTLSDHPQLAQPAVRGLFDALHARICELDPNVYQEVLKLYIAYKCETNFADIVPQSKGLRISLNMPFAELDDPRGLAKNVAGIGRWGNGEVEFRLSAPIEIPYAMGLIRQSLERQLDDNGGGA